MYASDGQNLWSQDDATQSHWIRTYGSEQAANAAWVAEHNREIAGQDGGHESGDGGGGGGGGGGRGGDDGLDANGNSTVNPDAVNQAYLIASQQAQQEYLNAKLEFEKHQFSHLSAYQKEELAFNRAKFKFEKSYQTALLTGQWNGKPTWQKQKDIADITGYFNGKGTFAREQFNASTAQGYLNMMAGLRGPRNAFQYAKVLSGTPNGMRDIIAAAAGQYALPGTGGGDPNAILEAASLQGLFEDAQNGYMGGYYDNAGNPIPGPTNPGYNPGSGTPGQPYAPGPGTHDSGLGPQTPAPPAPPPVTPGPGGTITESQGPGTTPGSGGQPFDIQQWMNQMLNRFQTPGTGTPAPQPQTPDPYLSQIQESAAGVLGGLGPQASAQGSSQLGTWMDSMLGGGEQPNQDEQTTTVSPPGVEAPQQMWNYEHDGQGSYTSYPPGVTAPLNNTQWSTMSATNPSNGWMPNDPARPGRATLQRSNQWNAKNIANMGQYQRDLLLAAHEAEGQDPQAVWDEFQKSLPKYGGPARGRIATS